MHGIRVLAAVAIVGAVASFGCSSASSPGATGGGEANGDAGAQQDAVASASNYCSYVDDAGVTHGCGHGSQGPGDRDDGGGVMAPPPDAALDASDLSLYSSCWDDSQCASGVCFLFGPKGQFCTKACTTNADCPAPSLGCNGMGFCRVGD